MFAKLQSTHQIIGRVQADPDYLPRNPDFGLNKVIFREKYCGPCPEAFWRIAFHCTEIDPDKRFVFHCVIYPVLIRPFRPSFRLLESWLKKITSHWNRTTSLTIPNDLFNEITTFSGFSRRKIDEELSD